MSTVSSRSWYFVDRTAQVKGPYNEVKLTDKLSSREISGQTLVWNGDVASKWTRLCNVPGLLPRLRRKSRGFSQLDEKLKKISQHAVAASRISSFGAFLSPQVSVDVVDYDSDDLQSVGSDIGTEYDEKCPVFMPRPLLNPMLSERTDLSLSPIWCDDIDADGVRACTESNSDNDCDSDSSSHDLFEIPKLVFTKTHSDHTPKLSLKRSISVDTSTMAEYAESPLCLADDGLFEPQCMIFDRKLEIVMSERKSELLECDLYDSSDSMDDSFDKCYELPLFHSEMCRSNESDMPTDWHFEDSDTD